MTLLHKILRDFAVATLAWCAVLTLPAPFGIVVGAGTFLYGAYRIVSEVRS